jgi:polyphosphate kinase
LPGLKVHAKVALVRMGKKAGLRDCAFFGTGNLNEKTARLYSDYTLLTSDQQMTKELASLFDYLSGKKMPDPFQRLLVSGFNMIPSFVDLIDRTIAEAKNGVKTRIFIKVNNLEEKAMISKLYEASRAGVEVQLLVRGVCCIRPQLKTLSQNIRVKRLVDRYLEHSRIFMFEYEKEPLIYLGSADWMNRNLHHRIEVVFPVLERRLKAQILEEVDWFWRDNCKAYELSPSGKNRPFSNAKQPRVRAQVEIYDSLKGRLKKVAKPNTAAGSTVYAVESNDT